MLRKRREVSSKKLQCNGTKEQQIQVSKGLDTVEKRVEMSTLSPGGCDLQQSKFFLHSISETKGELYENQSATE
jgi:hypothetical protein